MPGDDKDSRTERASPQKLKQSREQGQVARSQDLSGTIGVFVCLVMICLTGLAISAKIAYLFRHFFSRVRFEEVNSNGYFALITSAIGEYVMLCAPLLITIWLAVFISTVAQVGLHISFKPLEFDINKINPINGMKRLISLRSIITTSIGLTKMTVIAAMTWSMFINNHLITVIMKPINLIGTLNAVGAIAWDLCMKIAAVMLILSIVDYVYQKWQFSEDQKMSKEEVKQEYKNQEGDPHIKGRMKQAQRAMGQKKGLKANVQEADVVITNPIHLAVALKYNRDGYSAPIVVAKGSRLLAGRIKEFAREANVMIVENIPLARALYKNCPIDHEITPDLYVAVAEVLAFVYKQKNKQLL